MRLLTQVYNPDSKLKRPLSEVVSHLALHSSQFTLHPFAAYGRANSAPVGRKEGSEISAFTPQLY